MPTAAQPSHPGESVKNNTEGARNPVSTSDASQLQRRIDRNSSRTEEAQRQPAGGAHSDKPDPTNP